jgi:hypothetical protein
MYEFLKDYKTKLLVTQLCFLGVKNKEIKDILGVSLRTLYRHKKRLIIEIVEGKKLLIGNLIDVLINIGYERIEAINRAKYILDKLIERGIV